VKGKSDLSADVRRYGNEGQRNWRGDWQIVASVSSELQNWMAEAPQHDDVTFIVVKII
jgi:hypothetical protein